jgi:nucleotide-binding universal stress UspA family protein
MYKRILIPTDGSAISRKAAKQGVAFAKAIGATVVGFFSPEDYRAIMYTEYMPATLLSQEEFEAQAKKAAEKQLATIQKAAQSAGVDFESYWTISVAPWEAIIDAARKKKCDLIFMGSHGRRGLAGLVLGSTTTKVLTHSKVPVMVTR